MGNFCDILDISDPIFEKKCSEINSDNIEFWINFTPLLYINNEKLVAQNLNILNKSNGKRKLIIHETPFFSARYPKSMINGLRELRIMKMFARKNWSGVYSSSEHVERLYGKIFSNNDIDRVLLGSNIAVHQDNQEKRLPRKKKFAIIFGGGNNLYWSNKFVANVDKKLYTIKALDHWKFIGGADNERLDMSNSCKRYQFLDQAEISRFFSEASFLFVPHYMGLSAKRGTISTAMQHKVPVVGLRGAMTDSFWEGVDGVRLYHRSDPTGCANEIIRILQDNVYKDYLGKSNKKFFDAHMGWDTICDQILAK